MHRGLVAWLLILALACAGFVWAALALGQTANMVAAAYMLTPALAAVVARAFFHPPRFRDAALRPGPLVRYLWVWVGAVALVAAQYALFLASGAVAIDLTGQGYLEQIERVMPGGSATMLAQLPSGVTVPQMLALTTVGGLTVFNLPGVVLGLGEELGWRGFLFPQLYRIRPWLGLVGGGVLWFLWHLPLALLGPPRGLGAGQLVLDTVALLLGALATFVLFAWVFVRGGSIWVPSFFHAVLNNGSRAFSYWVRVEDQVVADVLLAAVMVAVVLALWRTGRLAVFAAWGAGLQAPSTASAS